MEERNGSGSFRFRVRHLRRFGALALGLAGQAIVMAQMMTTSESMSATQTTLYGFFWTILIWGLVALVPQRLRKRAVWVAIFLTAWG